MQKSDIALVIPTYNMADYIVDLLDSIMSSGLGEFVDEILIVNDGSTDDTLAIAEKVIRDNKDKIGILDLVDNKGRFLARYLGAKSVKSSRILFLDSRNSLGSNFVQSLICSAQKYQNVIGSVDIDVSKNIFCLYWDRTHKFIFKDHYKDSEHLITLNQENYDRYLKGTTVFLCNKELFVRSCEKFLESPILNDDVYLMKEMVKHETLFIDPLLRITWVPRENYIDFWKRLFERGPSFVEYHVFEHHGVFFWIVLCCLIALVSLILVGVFSPSYFLFICLFLASLVLLSTAIFAKNFTEFVRLVPLHVGTVISFGTGVVYGVLVNLKKLWKKRAKRMFVE